MAKKVFFKIADEKRRRVLDASAFEFARHGFYKANINTIAGRAGVSIGAMYNYFDSKEDLFLSTLNEGIDILKNGLARIFVVPNHNAFEKIDNVFMNIVELSKKKSDYIILYHSLACAGMDDLAARSGPGYERAGAEAFHKIIDEGVGQGLIDPKIDKEMAAFAMDNHFMIFLASMATTLHRVRLNAFMGVKTDDSKDLKRAALRISAHIKRSLSFRYS